MTNMSALSIRQPYAELIMRGVKRIEYRTQPTRKRGRVYIYASKTPGPPAEFRALGLKPGDLPTGVLIGTVEITGCNGREGYYEWTLANPQRLPEPVAPTRHPQPSWFFPF
jgi:hypothetical protein